MEQLDPLVDLRDARLPSLSDAAFAADVFLGIAIGLSIVLIIVILVRFLYDGEQIFRRNILHDLEASRKEPVSERLLSQVKLLRKLAGRLGVSVSPEWMQKIDEHKKGPVFEVGAGKNLSVEIYKEDPDFDPNELDDVILKLLKRVRG